MTGLAITRFAGETPRADAKLLPDSAALLAQNAKLTSGDLEPWKAPEFVATLPKWAEGTPVRKVYRLQRNGNDYWLHWVLDPLFPNETVSFFPSPTVADVYERYYYNEGGKLRITTGALAVQSGDGEYPSVAYRLGVVAPTDVPAVTPAPSIAPTLEDVVVSYCYTYQSIYGEESAPSPVSDLETGAPAAPGRAWTINMAAAPVLDADQVPLQYRNVYRTFTAADGSTVFQFVAQLPIATTSFEDTVEVLGEELASTNYDPPPDNVTAFTYLGNGVFVAAAGKTLYFCEPYQPHAFPLQYRRAIDSPVVALGAVGNSLIVLTGGDPIVLTGTDPSFLSDAKLDINQPCLSSSAVVNIGSAVAYMSPVGIVTAGLGGSDVLTRPLFSAADWLAISPSASSFASRYDNGLVFATDNRMHLLTPSEPLAVLTSLNITEVTSFYTDYETGVLYYTRNGELYQWDSGSQLLAYLFRSKEFVFPKPINLGACKIDSNAGVSNPGNVVTVPGGLGINESGINGGPVPYLTTTPALTFRLYARDHDADTYSLVFTKAITSPAAFRLPSGYMSDSIYFELEGTAEVHAVYLAESMGELKRIGV